MFQYLSYLEANDPELPLRPMKSPQYIYRLYCPITGNTRYIGMTSNPRRRLKEHCKGVALQDVLSDESVMNHLKREWIAMLRAQGVKPVMEVLEEVNPSEQVVLHELRWFLHYLQAGAPLTNVEMQLYGHFLPCIVRSMTCDFLNEPAGSEIWGDLQWAVTAPA